jgi:hypothetical protein
MRDLEKNNKNTAENRITPSGLYLEFDDDHDD